MLSSAKGTFEDNPVRYIDTQLRYHLHIDPTVLSDEDWAEQFAMLQDIREKEAKAKQY